MGIYLWQNILSPHQAPYIRSLAEIAGTEVRLFAQERVPEWRRNSGWSEPDFGRTIVTVRPDAARIRMLMGNATSADVHLFSGMRAYPMVWEAFVAALDSPARIGLISEPSDWRGIQGKARMLRARVDRMRYGRRIGLILAFGHLAVRWFRMVGYCDDLIFPFGYVTERPALTLERTSAPGASGVQLVYVGQCIHRKGVDLLISALAELKDLPWHLHVVGDGDRRSRLEEQCRTLGLSSRVTFAGSRPNEEAMRVLAASDLLILPSRWDGWGAVVNEALMRGIPVICSDTCGAADLLFDNERGDIFPSGSIDGLRDALRRRIEAGRLRPDQSARIRTWARAISGEAVAGYLYAVLAAASHRGPKPTPPWLSRNLSSK